MRMNKILKRSRLLLFYFLIISGQSFAQERDDYKIVITSDIHTSFQLNQCNSIFSEMRKHTLGDADSLIRFYRTIPQETDADAVIITGDLIDYYEAALNDNSEKMIDNQIEQFNALTAYCPVPVYFTLGNHDITSYRIDQADSSRLSTQLNAGKARAAWIRNTPCFNNGTYYSQSITVKNTTYHLIFLDNGYSLRDGGRIIDKTQLDWLENELDSAGEEPVLLLMHIYLAVGDINGDGIYFNKNKPLTWPDKEACSAGLLKLLNAHNNIKALFVGHQHNNVWEAVPFPAGHKIYQVMTSTLSRSRNNWRMIKLFKDAIIVSKPGGNEIELKIQY